MNNKFLQAGSILLSLVLVMSACTSREDEISSNTKGFLEAYFNIDYRTACSFCTQELGAELVASFRSLDSLEPAVRTMLEKQSREVKTEIISVSKERGKDSATVHYKVILPNAEQAVENTLSLVKKDKKWCIAELGNK